MKLIQSLFLNLLICSLIFIQSCENCSRGRQKTTTTTTTTIPVTKPWPTPRIIYNFHTYFEDGKRFVPDECSNCGNTDMIVVQRRVNNTNPCDIKRCICHGYMQLDILMMCTKTRLDKRTTKIIQINENKLGSSQVYSLDLSWKSIDDIEWQAFYNSNGLKNLDLSSNKLKELRTGMFNGLLTLKNLKISKNPLTVIAPSTFIDLPNLEVLEASSNRLTSLNENLFRENSALKLVKFDNNLLTNIPKLTHTLESLDMRNNKIVNLSAGTFESSKNLINLQLAHNKIQSIGKNLFAQLEKLKELDLSHNIISTIEENAFTGLVSIEKLLLKGNQIKSLPVNLFSRNRLRYFDLSSNLVDETSLPLKILIHLEQFDISNNAFMKFDNKSFIGLKSLKTLKINNLPKLVQVNDFTFSPLKSLQELSICSNPKFSRLSRKAFNGIKSKPLNLKKVHMFDNQLSQLDEDTLPVCEVDLRLHGNPWKCDCDLKWAKKICKTGFPIRCASPPAFANRDIVTIPEAEFINCTIPEKPKFNRPSYRLPVIIFMVTILMVTISMAIITIVVSAIFCLLKVKGIQTIDLMDKLMGLFKIAKNPTPDDDQETDDHSS